MVSYIYFEDNSTSGNYCFLFSIAVQQNTENYNNELERLQKQVIKLEDDKRKQMEELSQVRIFIVNIVSLVVSEKNTVS